MITEIGFLINQNGPYGSWLPHDAEAAWGSGSLGH